MAGRVGLLLRGRDSDRDAVGVALDLAGGRPEEIVVLHTVPNVVVQTALQAGIDPLRLRAGIELERRRAIRELFAAAGGGTRFPISTVARPLTRSVPRAARREGCGVLVIAGSARDVLLWSLRTATRAAGVDIRVEPGRRPPALGQRWIEIQKGASYES